MSHDIETTAVEFRTPSPTPTEPGFYYARLPDWSRIEPVAVIDCSDGFYVVTLWHSDRTPAAKFTFFGRIRNIEESKFSGD